jgi:hypothetical protein
MKYRKAHIILIIIITVFATNTVESSLLNSLKAKIGVYGGINSNSHKADFMMLPDVPNCCVEYGNSNSRRYGFKVFGEVSIFNLFDIQVAAGYNEIGADLKAAEYIGNTEVNDDVFPVFTTHNLEADIGVLSFNPSISIVPYRDIPLRLGVGFETGIMLQKSIYQHEDLSREAIENGVIFYDGNNDVGTTRNTYKGDIPYTNNYNVITLSAAYDIELLNRFTLRPEVIYRHCLSDIAPSVQWKIDNLTFGISICYSLYQDQYDMKYFIDPIIADSIPEKISSEQKVSEREMNQANAMLLDLSNDYKERLSEEEQTADQQIKENAFSCCYIIFYTSTEENESEKILEKLKSKMQDLNIYIQEWMNPESELIYYRVRTYCFDDYNETFKVDNQYKELNIKVNQPSIIKCY